MGQLPYCPKEAQSRFLVLYVILAIKQEIILTLVSFRTYVTFLKVNNPHHIEDHSIQMFICVAAIVGNHVTTLTHYEAVSKVRVPYLD